ncbi:MAG: hypothetical protein IKQ93_00465 [Candidatus Methanomethylophilaceae archaeon]|nr:hypothetical protein [Candidatus Methanomethylophilaceae archaeon]
MNPRLSVAIQIVLAVVALAAVFMLASDINHGPADEGRDSEPSVKEIPSDDWNAVVTGDIADGKIDIDIADGTFVLRSAGSGDWRVFDNDAPSSTSKTLYRAYKGDVFKDTDTVEISHPGYGSFDVTFDSGDVKYRGSVVIDGTVERDYYWSVNGDPYEMQLSFQYSDYDHYRNKDVDRYASNRDRTVFVDGCDGLMDSVISKITGQTEGLSEYERANVILAFVQECFEYPPNTMSGSIALMSGDMYLTGHSDYSMYPIETIFREAGDCEDTSILAAALFKAAGFHSALLTVPGHAMACVAIEDGSASKNISEVVLSMEIYHAAVDGREYYVCETTTSYDVSVGFGSTQDFGGHQIPYYMHKAEGSLYGMFLIG